MNKIINLTKVSSLLKVALFCLSFLFFQLNTFSQNGEDIFNANCTACHFATADRLVGPGLAGVNDRHTREWLIDWVKDSQKMVEAGDEAAVALFEEYLIPMQSFGDVLTEDEINAVFDFLNGGGSDRGSAGADIAAGEKVFKANCTACHSIGANKLVGPGLEGINDKYSQEWLLSWVKNSQKMVADGDAEAIAIFDEYKIPMQSYEGILSDEDITNLFAYVANPEGAASADEPAEVVVGEVNETGKKLFKANCAACHSVGANKVVGPGLQGINDKYSREWLGKWIKNSGELIASGDADANSIFNEYSKMPMPPQPVNDEEIDAILDYISYPAVPTVSDGGDSKGSANVEEESSVMIYVLLGVVLILIVLVIILGKRGVIMNKLVAQNEGEEYKGPTSLYGKFKELLGNNKGIVAALVIVLFFGGLVDLMDGAFQIGVHQGYKPEQPIKFSHKIHAGDDKIDCNYCHSSARHSKTSGIPSLNVCMNCHKYIDGSSGKTFMYNGEEYSMTEEIQKIYDHLDYDKATQQYGDNPTPVQWIKVHNLPDHVYYSHQQHVVAGKQKCQTCHGPVEEMDVVEQHSELTMKWCIECHQKTAVATEGNGYYDDMHKRMTPEFKEKVLSDGVLTVDEIGGWECAKCHY